VQNLRPAAGAIDAAVLHEMRATTPERLTMKVELTEDWCMNMAKIEERADDPETTCVWCEQRVRGACKSHYDTLTCTHRVMVPTAEQWDSAVEARNGEPTHPAQWSAGYDAGFKDGHQAACEALQRDAERYRWLRLQDWDTCPLAVVANPKEAIKLGHDAPSRERLDAMIDAPLAEVRAAVNSALERAGRSDLGA
jgi:hypothetical protein